MRFLATASFVLLTASAAPAAQVMSGISAAPRSGISVQVTNIYDSLPPSGFVPIRVEIKNNTASKRTWVFLGTNQAMNIAVTTSLTQELNVPGGESRTFEFLVPIASQGGGPSRYSNLVLSIAGHGISNGVANDYFSASSSNPLSPFTGIGAEHATPDWGKLKTRLDTESKRDLDGTALDLRMLSADWRALSGFANIILSASEWRSLTDARRAAILDWIAQGGRLAISQAGGGGGLPQAGPMGSGSIEIWEPGDFVSQASKFLLGAPKLSSTRATEDYLANWAPLAKTGLPAPPFISLIIFVLAFGVIIGPVNFQFLAPPGARHKLFVTIPVISLLASLVLGVIIVLSEGFGGKGEVVAATLILPKEHKAVVWQEQASRTGVLFSNSFPEPSGSLILPVSISRDASRPRFRQRRPASYSLAGGWWNGSWFHSRTAQAQVITSVLPSRERLEVRQTANSTPVVTAGFEEPIEDVWWFDANGGAWHVASLQPGEGRPMDRADAGEFQAGWKRSLSSAGPVVRSNATRFSEERLKEKFFARIPNSRVTQTLPTIRWSPTTRLVMGEARAEESAGGRE